MKKFELVQAIAKETGYTQEVVNNVIDAMQPIVVEACVERGEEVNLPELGKFKRQIFKARKGRNPLTGEALDIPESHTVSFKASIKNKKIIQPKKSASSKKSKK